MSDSVEQAREAALRILERRRRTRRELEERLSRAGHSPDAVRGALDRLHRVGLVDDLEYASAFLRERLSRRAVGDRILQRELLRRGIPLDVVRQAQAAFRQDPARSEGASESDRARKALGQLRARYAKLDPHVARRRLFSAMARRGFSVSHVEAALAELDEAPPPRGTR